MTGPLDAGLEGMEDGDVGVKTGTGERGTSGTGERVTSGASGVEVVNEFSVEG